jgi:hypothetical protein
MLDPLEPVIRKVLEEVPDIKAPRLTELLRDDCGYTGSVDLVRKHLAALRPRTTERPAQRTGYGPGHVMQVDWAQLPTRPRLWAPVLKTEEKTVIGPTAIATEGSGRAGQVDFAACRQARANAGRDGLDWSPRRVGSVPANVVLCAFAPRGPVHVSHDAGAEPATAASANGSCDLLLEELRAQRACNPPIAPVFAARGVAARQRLTAL